jgi:peroxiredoxin
MKGRKHQIIQWAAIALGLALVVVALVRAGARRPENAAASLVVGQAAPDFVLSDLAGREVALARFRGKFVLLGFWVSWCPPCREEMPSLQKLHEDFAGRDLVLLAVNTGESPDQVADFVRRREIAFPVLLDTDGRVQERYGAYQFPVFFLIDREGRIAAHYLGLRDWSSTAVRQELAEKIGR